MMKKYVLLLLMMVSAPAYGMVYTWTDSAGITHFTNKEYEIPARYRARVKARYPEQTDTAAPQQNFQTPSPSLPPTAAVPEVKPAVPQAKPEQPAKSIPAVSTPPPQQNPPPQATRKGRRSRGSSEE